MKVPNEILVPMADIITDNNNIIAETKMALNRKNRTETGRVFEEGAEIASTSTATIKDRYKSVMIVNL